MEGIGSILPKTIKRAGIEKEIKFVRVIELFEDNKDVFLSPDLSGKVRAIYFKDNTLNIASLSAQASQELTARQNDIVEWINNEMDEKIVEKVKIIV